MAKILIDRCATISSGTLLLKPGSLLRNRYTIHEQLGQGGMGKVFLATDSSFDRAVAIKSSLVTSSISIQSFEREAKLLSTLRHPSLPVVIDYFVEEQTYCLVMDYVPGDSLATLIRRQRSPLSMDRAMKIGTELLDVLEYLHSNNPQVVHRDIKPDNLKINRENRLMLLDFGLAKASTHGQSQSISGFTPQYAPLEQLRSSGTDPRSDLFSAAATIYHLMTGRQAPSALERADAVLNGLTDPLQPANQIHHSVPDMLSHALESALHLDLNQRPQSARHLREAFAQKEQGASISYKPTVITPIRVEPVPTTVETTKISNRFFTKNYVLGVFAFVAFVILYTWIISKPEKRESPLSSQNPAPTAAPEPKMELLKFIDNENLIPVLAGIPLNGEIRDLIPSN